MSTQIALEESILPVSRQRAGLGFDHFSITQLYRLTCLSGDVRQGITQTWHQNCKND